MEVRIVQLLQQMNFQTRKSTTFVVLELPDGSSVHAAVDDEAATAIIRADVEANGQAPVTTTAGEALALPPNAEPEPPDYQEPPPVVVSETENEQVRVFGGELPAQAAPSEVKKGGGGKKKKAQAAPPPPPEPPPTPPPPPPVPRGPEPRSKKAYEKMVKDGVLQENANFRTVPAVEGGYPAVVVRDGTADPESVTGRFNRDEDGVGSV